MGEQAEVVLFEDGTPRFALHRLPWQSAEDILEPADELARHLEECLGAEVPCARPAGGDGHPVALVLHRDVRADLGREEFELDVAPERVVLRARTVQAMGHAVYWFLETWLGVRWLWPGETGTVTPRTRRLALPVGVHREAPDYAWRAIQTGGAIWQAMDAETALHGVLGLSLSYLEEFKLWQRRNRFGGLRVADGHRWAEIAPPEQFGKSHPDYYALVDGKRDCEPRDGKHGNQPCLSNPDVAKLVADYAIARFDADRALDVFSVALNDGGASCECDACRAIDEEAGAEGTQTEEHFDRVTGELRHSAKRSVTDRLCLLMQDVAARVRERHPDRMLLTHLYGHYRRPPVKHSLPPGVMGQYCVMASLFWDEKIARVERERVPAIGKAAPDFAIYEYYSTAKWPELHRLFPRLVADSVRAYHAAGARYFATQPSTGFAANGLNLFVLGRCLWDVSTDPDDVIRDFCESGFGPAAGPVRKYLDAFAERWKETASGTQATAGVNRFAGFARLYPKEFLAARREDLVKARAAASGDRGGLGRIDFLALGLEHTSLYCAVCDATERFLSSAKAESAREVAGKELDTETVGLAFAACEAWAAYWDFVRQRMGQFVFGEFWVHYRTGLFGDSDPELAALREIVEG